MVLTPDGHFLLSVRRFDYFVTSSDASLYGNAFCIIPPFHHLYMIKQDTFQSKTTNILLCNNNILLQYSHEIFLFC